MREQVRCKRCDGTGRHEMPPTYATVYRLISHTPQTTTELLAAFNGQLAHTALLMRLAWLKREGFVTSAPTETSRLMKWFRT